MVATPQTFVATTIGRVAIPKLADTLVRTGADKFVKVYGQKAFEAVLGTAIGARAYSKTEEYISEYLNHIDTGGDENSFVPKGSMPTATRAEQMDAVMAVPNTTAFANNNNEGKEEETTGTELSTEVKEEPPKLPEEPPKGPDIGTELATEAVTQATKKILEDKKPDVTKQTKDLVPEKPDFGKLTKTEIQTAKALKEGKPDFYSRAVESIKNAKQEKFTKGKWKSIVQSNSTKDEMKYLGLDKYLQGNESITKKELLKFVESKDIAPNITVRSIPKDEMNTMYEGYSLGGYTAVDTQEHIVFQVKPEFYDVKQGKKPTIDSYVFTSGHFDPMTYGKNTFAHARTQVGFDQLEGEMTRYQDLNNEEIEKAFKNTLIIDEIQSDWLQKGQDKGFVSDFEIIPGDKLVDYFKKHNISYKISDPPLTVEFQQKDGEEIEPGDAPAMGVMNSNIKYFFRKSDNTEAFKWDPTGYEEDAQYSTPEEFLQKAYGIVPDFPIKESKKWVELVLNKMIEKAILDGRDSIAITNGQIQYNRYDAQQEEDKKGLKKFYDEIVFKQLEKISDKYNVELERIDITEGQPEAPKELQDAHLDNQIKRAQDDGFVLKKVNLQFLFDRTRDTDIPGHAALYSDTGVGQGHDYIENYVSDAILDGERWDEIKNNEVYIWIKERDISRDLIGWELPIVPVQDAHTTVVSTTEVEKHLETLSNQDLEIYSLYLKGIEPPQGEETGPEQLIKMKLPKKLKKERLSKPIKLSKAKKQTDRLFA